MAQDKLEVSIWLEAVYKKFGEDVRYGTISTDVDENDEEAYFDLRNERGEVACMDCEDHEVLGVNATERYIEFRDDHGEEPVSFKLSFDEAAVALEPRDIKKIEERTGVSLTPDKGTKGKSNREMDR